MNIMYIQRCFIILLFLLRLRPEELAGNRVVLFSYGSGLASSMYSLRASTDLSPDSPLRRLQASLADLEHRLDSRKKVDPADFEKALKLREETHHLGKEIVNRGIRGYSVLVCTQVQGGDTSPWQGDCEQGN